MLWPRLTIFLEIFKIQSKIHQRFSNQNFLTPLTILKSLKPITCMLYYTWESHYCMLYHYSTIAQYSTIPLYSRIASLLLSLWLSDMSRLECTWLSLCADGATACRLDQTHRNTRELTSHFYGWLHEPQCMARKWPVRPGHILNKFKVGQLNLDTLTNTVDRST